MLALSLAFVSLADQLASHWLIDFLAHPLFLQEVLGCFLFRFSLKIRFGFGLSGLGLVSASQSCSKSRGSCYLGSLVGREVHAHAQRALPTATRLAMGTAKVILELVSAWQLQQTSYAQVRLI